jgi:predicted dinucleotide-binding enzyme
MTTIGILGGTGAHGRGLARRFALASYEVVIGSRKAERAQAVAAAYGGVRGGSNAEGAGLAADLIAINRRYQVHAGIKITDLQ